MTTPLLFSPIRLRELTLRNRIVVSPMCQYAATFGRTTPWHLAHHARFALGGVGAAFVEATGVSADGRITHGCTGLYEDAHIDGMRAIVDLYREQGAACGIQLGHAGRKASTATPREGAGPLSPGGDAPAWETIAPSALPGRPGWHVPRAMNDDDIARVIADFRAATERAERAGFDLVEIHGAHGYLLHSFFSPLSNARDDAYGGDLAGRMRFILAVTEAMRAAWPAHKPLFYRASVVDGEPDGITVEETIALARELKVRGVDVIDCSSGGIAGSISLATTRPTAGFQLPLAQAVRHGADIATMAVGLIVDPFQAEEALEKGQADLIALGRELIADPNWAFTAAKALGHADPYAVLPDSYAFFLRRRGEVARA